MGFFFFFSNSSSSLTMDPKGWVTASWPTCIQQPCTGIQDSPQELTGGQDQPLKIERCAELIQPWPPCLLKIHQVGWQGAKTHRTKSPSQASRPEHTVMKQTHVGLLQWPQAGGLKQLQAIKQQNPGAGRARLPPEALGRVIPASPCFWEPRVFHGYSQHHSRLCLCLRLANSPLCVRVST